MILRHRTPGEPLVVLALILAGWVGARVVAWEAAFDTLGAERMAAADVERAGHGSAVRARVTGDRQRTGSAVAAGLVPQAAPFALAPFWSQPPGFVPDRALPPAAPLVAMPASAPASSAPATLLPVSPPVAAVPVPPPGAMPAAPAGRIAVAGGHQLLWLAVTAYLPVLPQGSSGLRAATTAPAAPAGPARRWSADGWLLLRRGDGQIAPGPVVGNYGASQMGAVLRYRLDTADAHRPAAYVRVTAALNGTREQQVAAGFSARPLPRLPLTAMAELREVRDSAGERLRPALALVTELPPRRLPLGFTGEAYAQGGYVGGRNPTAFIDGLVRAERPLVDAAGFRLRAGGGAWGAKQRGAARVDVGPTASVSFRLTDTASARLAADWRFRVGGQSKPDSGPALTLSAGF